MTSNPSGEAGRTAAKWTPGPWRIDGVFPNEPMNIEGQAFDGSWKYICIAIHGGNPKQREANAKLIAKAPELAAILQEIVELVRAEAQVDNGEGLKFLNASAQLVEAERILREAGALEETR